jgi:hypothetical protein
VFEADLPRLEDGQCRHTGTGCLLLPLTDSGQPAAFHPFFSAFLSQGSDAGDARAVSVTQCLIAERLGTNLCFYHDRRAAHWGNLGAVARRWRNAVVAPGAAGR